MPYTHYHDRSFHTHHRRPKGGNHYWNIRRRQRPWRIASIAVFLFALTSGTIVAGIYYDNHLGPLTNSIQQIVPDEAERELRQRTRLATAETKKQARIAEINLQQEHHERKIVELINLERQRRNIGTMTWDPKLQQIARAHSRDMANLGYFSHTNKSGRDYRQRALDAGYYCKNYKWQGVAENIYFGGGTHGQPEDAVQNWLGSPGHRRAMLDPTFTKAAIGIQEGDLSGYGTGYFTALLLC